MWRKKKKGRISLPRKMLGLHTSKRAATTTEMQMLPVSPTPPNNVGAGNSDSGGGEVVVVAAGGVGSGRSSNGGGKKKAGLRLWMRFDRSGQTELLECDKSAIVRRAAIPPCDLRILGPVFSHSSNNILARDKAMVINLEFVKAIVTAEEVLLLDPLSHEVLPFVDQLRCQLSVKSPSKMQELCLVDMQGKEMGSPTYGPWLSETCNAEGERSKLPFEFQVLEIALEVVCAYLESNVVDLERIAYPVLDELTRNVSTKNLDRVLSLKSNLTRLLVRVLKVKGEIEHLLDANEVMAHLYLTRRQIQNQQYEALMAAGASNSIVAAGLNDGRYNSDVLRSPSVATGVYSDDNDVEDLEMLLEAYLMQLDGTHSKILSVREYIDDTEDCVNIQLDNKRNELIQLQLIITIASFPIAINTLIIGLFSMNIHCQLYDMSTLFWPFIEGTSSGCFFIFLLILSYARWKKLLGS